MKRASAQTVKLGLIQTAGSADPDANLKKTLALAVARPNAARKSFARRNYSARSIFARAKTTNISSSPNPFRPTTDAFCQLAKKHKLSSSPRFLRNAPPVFITTPL